ncbi:ribonuclease YeeF family protein [Metabacillus fastidiosus]|uniref:ribonuclease YeeF family protein n=1 Tax=Metabacillus fastidiosus TaxID=1458 RepID=UPI003D2E25F8
MKILDVDVLTTGLNVSNKMVDDQQEQINSIAKDLKSFLSLDESFQGKGAEAIKSFYQECHVPFLSYYDQFLVNFRRALSSVEEAYPAVEPEKNGYIHESFLENDLSQGLNNIKNKTIEMTDEVNDIVDKVDDIVSLPKISDDEVIKGIQYSKKKIDNMVTKLHKFDTEQTKVLQEIENELFTLVNYVKEIESMFKSGDISVDNFNIKKFQQSKSYHDLQTEMDKIDWTAVPISSTPSILFDTTAPVSSYGNTFGTVAEAHALTETASKVYKHKVGIHKSKDGYRVQNGKYIGIKRENYPKSWIDSQLKLGNNPEIAKHVRPSAAVSSAFKSKMGAVGIGITATENAVKNIQSNASTSKVVGDAVVDVGLGAVSLAGGAVVVSTAVALGAPIVAAAAVGFAVSLGAAYVIEGIKVGKNEKNLSETLKDGVQKGIKTVAGWFK